MLEKTPSGFSMEDGFQKAQTAPRKGGVETAAAVQERVMAAWPWMIAVEIKKMSTDRGIKKSLSLWDRTTQELATF